MLEDGDGIARSRRAGRAPSPGGGARFRDCGAKTSGPASRTMSSAAKSPAKSPVKHSTFAEGTSLWIIRTVLAKMAAPPSARSSRSTAVRTRYAQPKSRTASATRLGSSQSTSPPRAAGLHVAEIARARARVAQDHNRRGSRAPALADVRAHGFLADGVQVEIFHVALEPFVVFAVREFDFEPVGFAGDHQAASSCSKVRPNSRSRDASTTPVASSSVTRPAEFARHGGDPELGQPARIDQAVVVERAAHVEREPV